MKTTRILLNVAGLIGMLWMSPVMTMVTFGMLLVERRVHCSGLAWRHLRNAMPTFLFAAAKALLTGLSAWAVGRALYECGGPFIVWDANDAIARHWWMALPCFLGVLFANDVLSYLSHRFLSHGPLWFLHTVHHSDRNMDVTSSYRHAGLEAVISIFVTAIPAKLVNLTPPDVVVLAFVIEYWSLALHTSLHVGFGPITPLFASPQFHRIHHSMERRHHNKNFAVFFPIIDIIGDMFSWLMVWVGRLIRMVAIRVRPRRLTRFIRHTVAGRIGNRFVPTFYWPAPDEFPNTGVEGVGPPTLLESIFGQRPR